MVGLIETVFEVGVYRGDWVACSSSSSPSQRNIKMAACFEFEKVVVRIREFDPEKDVEKVERLELQCEVGQSGEVSLFTDLLGDPLCRVRHSPAYVMLVAEIGQEREIVGLIRGCIKTVVCGRNIPAEDALKESSNPRYTKAAYILGLRVSPRHRRLGIGLKLVQTLEAWLKENGAEYAYMATEKDNEASIKLFTEKCNFSKFRTPAILVHPVHAHSKRTSSGVKILKLNVQQAEALYRHRLGTREFFPADIEAVVNNKLSLGTWVAFPSKEGWPSLQNGQFRADFPNSWAVISVWNSGDVFKMQVKGVSSLKCMCAATTRVLDRSLPWLKIPSIPDVFRPFGLHFLYGLHTEGSKGPELMKNLWRFCYNLARKSRKCRLIATEVSCCDPLRDFIPHWEIFSCPEDLWCIKKLVTQEDTTPDWSKSPPSTQMFVDPRDF